MCCVSTPYGKKIREEDTGRRYGKRIREAGTGRKYGKRIREEKADTGTIRGRYGDCTGRKGKIRGLYGKKQEGYGEGTGRKKRIREGKNGYGKEK